MVLKLSAESRRRKGLFSRSLFRGATVYFHLSNRFMQLNTGKVSSAVRREPVLLGWCHCRHSLHYPNSHLNWLGSSSSPSSPLWKRRPGKWLAEKPVSETPFWDWKCFIRKREYGRRIFKIEFTSNFFSPVYGRVAFGCFFSPIKPMHG